MGDNDATMGSPVPGGGSMILGNGSPFVAAASTVDMGAAGSQAFMPPPGHHNHGPGSHVYGGTMTAGGHPAAGSSAASRLASPLLGGMAGGNRASPLNPHRRPYSTSNASAEDPSFILSRQPSKVGSPLMQSPLSASAAAADAAVAGSNAKTAGAAGPPALSPEMEAAVGLEDGPAAEGGGIGDLAASRRALFPQDNSGESSGSMLSLATSVESGETVESALALMQEQGMEGGEAGEQGEGSSSSPVIITNAHLQVHAALWESCLDADAEALTLEMPGEPISGSTAVMLLLRMDETGVTLYCANVGDSRAVLSRGGTAIALSYDHKPSRPDERARIEAAGGTVIKDRLHGILAVSRAFGDAEHKMAKGMECWGKQFSSDPLSAEPETTLEPLQPEDEFVVLGCDGLWDVISSQQVVNFVRKRLLCHGDVARASRELVSRAIALGSVDNVSAVVVAFGGFQAPLAVRKRLRKMRNAAQALGNGRDAASSSAAETATASSP